MEYVPHVTSTTPITYARSSAANREEASNLPGEILSSVIGNGGNTIYLLPLFCHYIATPVLYLSTTRATTLMLTDSLISWAYVLY